MALWDIKILYSFILSPFNPSLCQMMPAAKVTCVSDQVTNQSLVFEAQISWTCHRPLGKGLADLRPMVPSLEMPHP